eukprot:6238250-Ditylum_brightwellii.AAC.1
MGLVFVSGEEEDAEDDVDVDVVWEMFSRPRCGSGSKFLLAPPRRRCRAASKGLHEQEISMSNDYFFDWPRVSLAVPLDSFQWYNPLVVAVVLLFFGHFFECRNNERQSYLPFLRCYLPQR